MDDAVTQAEDNLPEVRDFDLISGKLRRAKGALGQFEVVIDALRQVDRVAGDRSTGPRPVTARAANVTSSSTCAARRRCSRRMKNAKATCAPIPATRLPWPPPCWLPRISPAHLSSRSMCGPSRCSAPIPARGKPAAPIVWTFAPLAQSRPTAIMLRSTR
jgi:hypothetical protein